MTLKTCSRVSDGVGGRGVEDCRSHSTGPHSGSMIFIYTTHGHPTVRFGKMSVPKAFYRRKILLKLR